MRYKEEFRRDQKAWYQVFKPRTIALDKISRREVEEELEEEESLGEEEESLGEDEEEPYEVETENTEVKLNEDFKIISFKHR